MKKYFQSLITLLIMIVMMFGIYGCTKEGPVEKAGKKIDKTIEKAGEQIEKVGDNIQDAAKDPPK